MQFVNALIEISNSRSSISVLKSFLILQAYYDLEKEIRKIEKLQPGPDLSIIRKSTFWDVDLDSIDFRRHSTHVIKRVFERGNEDEILEIIKFYGMQDCKKVISEASSLFYAAADNAIKYLNLDKSEIKCLRNFTGTLYQKPWLRS